MKKKIGEYLIEKGLITAIQLKTSLGEQQNFGEILGEILVKHGFISEGELLESIAEMENIKFVDMANLKSSQTALRMLPINFCKEHTIYPLRLRESNRKKTLYVAISDFYNLDLLSQIQFTTGVDNVDAVLATKRAINAAIGRDYEYQDIEIPSLNYEKQSSLAPEEDDLIVKSDEVYGQQPSKESTPKKDVSDLGKLKSKFLDLELEVESLRKRMKNRNEDLELDLGILKKKLKEKNEEIAMMEKRLIAVVKLLIKKGIFSKEDFFLILKKMNS